MREVEDGEDERRGEETSGEDQTEDDKEYDEKNDEEPLTPMIVILNEHDEPKDPSQQGAKSSGPSPQGFWDKAVADYNRKRKRREEDEEEEEGKKS